MAGKIKSENFLSLSIDEFKKRAEEGYTVLDTREAQDFTNGLDRKSVV